MITWTITFHPENYLATVRISIYGFVFITRTREELIMEQSISLAEGLRYFLTQIKMKPVETIDSKIFQILFSFQLYQKLQSLSELGLIAYYLC